MAWTPTEPAAWSAGEESVCVRVQVAGSAVPAGQTFALSKVGDVPLAGNLPITGELAVTGTLPTAAARVVSVVDPSYFDNDRVVCPPGATLNRARYSSVLLTRRPTAYR